MQTIYNMLQLEFIYSVPENKLLIIIISKLIITQGDTCVWDLIMIIYLNVCNDSISNIDYQVQIKNSINKKDE